MLFPLLVALVLFLGSLIADNFRGANPSKLRNAVANVLHQAIGGYYWLMILLTFGVVKFT